MKQAGFQLARCNRKQHRPFSDPRTFCTSYYNIQILWARQPNIFRHYIFRPLFNTCETRTLYTVTRNLTSINVTANYIDPSPSKLLSSAQQLLPITEHPATNQRQVSILHPHTTRLRDPCVSQPGDIISDINLVVNYEISDNSRLGRNACLKPVPIKMQHGNWYTLPLLKFFEIVNRYMSFENEASYYSQLFSM